MFDEIEVEERAGIFGALLDLITVVILNLDSCNPSSNIDELIQANGKS